MEEQEQNNTGEQQTPEGAPEGAPQGGEQTTPQDKGQQGDNKHIGMAVVAYILFFVPLLTDSKDDPFVLYHVRQGFVLFVAFILAGVISWIPSPLMVFGMLLQLALVIVAIMGIINALGGKKEPLPVLGQFADKAPF
jgi:uncharacterized membrane protein